MYCLKKIIRVDFSRHVLSKSKIGLPNLDFNEFFCRKRLILSKKHVNRCLYIKFEENRLNRFWDNQIKSHFRLTLPHFRLLNFRQNLEIFSMYLFDTLHKICYFSVYWFLSYKSLNIPHTGTFTHIYTYITIK